MINVFTKQTNKKIPKTHNEERKKNEKKNPPLLKKNMWMQKNPDVTYTAMISTYG